MSAAGRRLRHAVAATGVALLGPACGAPTAPPFPGDAPPTTFVLSVGGFGFGSHDVTLAGDTLVVWRRPFFSPDSARLSRVVPTRADWQAFWRAADAAGVRRWAHECADRGVVDGGGFSLEIAYDGGRVQASGANAYPRRDGRCRNLEPTPEYLAFLAAVSRLIGRPYP